MIYTLTVNPAIDYVISLDEFNIGTINRTKSEALFAGGKGINVSTVLNNLGNENTALGFVAGPTGDMLEKMLKDNGIRADFTHVSEGNTRINVKMHAGRETEINGAGPVISARAIADLYGKIEQINASDTLIMSGNIPNCLTGACYAGICEELRGMGINLNGVSFYSDICALIREKTKDGKLGDIAIVIDATGKALMDCLKYHPFLIKPNLAELEEIFGVAIDSPGEALTYAKRLWEMGAVNVMVSMASKGAVLADWYGDSHICKAPEGNVVNSVGAGDTAVAAFISEYIRLSNPSVSGLPEINITGDNTNSTSQPVNYDQILKYSVAAGSATAFKTGLATAEDISRCLQA